MRCELSQSRDLPVPNFPFAGIGFPLPRHLKQAGKGLRLDEGAVSITLLLQGLALWTWSVDPTSPQDIVHVGISRSFNYRPHGGLMEAEAATDMLA